MRIQSKFRDFYDHISHMYGQDPLVVYERKPLPQTIFSKDLFDREALAALGVPEVRRHDVGSRHYSGASIVAGRYVFPMLRYWAEANHATRSVIDQWELADADNPAHRTALTDEWQDKTDTGPRRWRYRLDKPLVPTRTPPEEHIYRAIRVIGVPVFAVTDIRWKEIALQERIPILADHGIPALVAPEQMWQNLFHVLSNVLRRSPDKEPPCVVNNEERIQAAGFDSRSSFRHPVNPKKM